MKPLIPMIRSAPCAALLALLVSGLVWGMTPARADATPSATQFLKQSMSCYQALTSFQAECGWNETYDGILTPQASGIDADIRTILYVKPNQFKVVSSHYGNAFVQTSVSDGKHLVEYSSMASMAAMNYPAPAAMTYPAPASIAAASSMQMGHPMFCGTLLYRFFGGPDSLLKLAYRGRPITYGPDVAVADEPCKTVRLNANGIYGNVEIAISTRDHLVRRITYDSAPIMAMMAGTQTTVPPQLKNLSNGQKIPMPTSSVTVEEYRKIVVNQPIAQGAFDTTLPKGQRGAAGSPPVR